MAGLAVAGLAAGLLSLLLAPVPAVPVVMTEAPSSSGSVATAAVEDEEEEDDDDESELVAKAP